MSKRSKKRKAIAELIYYFFIMLVCLSFYWYAKLLNSGLSPSQIKLLFTSIVLLVIVLILSTFLFIKRRNRIKYLQSPLSKVDNMSGIEFEKFLKAHFENLGYKVKLTPTTNDYGADLICKNKQDTIVIQAKRYNSTVGNSAIQEIVAAKAYYKANRCMVITNSHFSSNAISLAKANSVELWDRDNIVKKLNVSNDHDPASPVDSKPVENNDIESALQNIKQTVSQDKICPKCGGTLVQRTAQKGKYKDQQFWGCSNYPRCKYIINN